MEAISIQSTTQGSVSPFLMGIYKEALAPKVDGHGLQEHWYGRWSSMVRGKKRQEVLRVQVTMAQSLEDRGWDFPCPQLQDPCAAAYCVPHGPGGQQPLISFLVFW